jgi:hypothetical protein
MPEGTLRRCLSGARFCASCLLTLVTWTLWLALALLLSFQVYIASVNELQVPHFLLRAIEDHLAESGVTVKFGRATFDPSGRLLLEKASFKLESFAEPVVTADAIYLRLDPLALLARRFEAREIRATGANLFIPAMLSASGRAEKIVQDLDAGFSITSRGDEFSVDFLSCRMGTVIITAHGTVNAGTVARNNAEAASLPLAEFLSRNYVALSREFSRAEDQMAGLEGPMITAELIPSDTRGAIVNAELFADGLRVASPAVEAAMIRARCRFPLLGGAPLMTSVVATAESLRVGPGFSATGVRARARGILKIDTLSFDTREMDFTAGSVTYGAYAVSAPIATVVPRGGRAYRADVSALVLGLPVSARGDVDLAARSADGSFDGSFAPGLVERLSERMGSDLRRFADLTEPFLARGRFRFAPGWVFADASARVDARHFTSYHVRFDEARGVVSYDGTHFAARDAVAVSGDNFAMGSYEQDFSTQEFRYLLGGRLRPLDISAWFGGGWWSALFGNFDFPRSPPDANVDVHGRYVKGGRVFSVFGFIDAKEPILKGVPFDSARALIYVDQFACDGLDVFLARGPGSAQGSFKLTTEPMQGLWSALDIDATSTLDPAPVAKLLPPDGEAAVEAFSFDQAPEIAIRGHFDGPAASGDAHRTLRTDVRAGGGFRVHGVAFDKASFRVDLDDDDIHVSGVDAGFAGGTATGSGEVTGAGAERRLRFKASLDGASLGQAAAAAEGYVSAGAPGTSTALDTFAKDKSGVRLDLNASAEGRPGSLGSFVGDGNVQIQGGKLGELSLLGGLSKVLKFPELRFTQARASFKIADSNLNFGDISVIGANSAIRAKGTYLIDRRLLDFSATVYPFMESKSILQVFNALSAPLSAMLRVKLSGSIDKPTWRLAYSPLNLLRVDEVKASAADKSGSPAPVANPPP